MNIGEDFLGRKKSSEGVGVRKRLIKGNYDQHTSQTCMKL